MGGFGGGGGGSKKNGGTPKNARRWRDEVWTMRYLPGFKWGRLSEQIGEHPLWLRPFLAGG
jgi:ESF2/ABP1 family protein